MGHEHDFHHQVGPAGFVLSTAKKVQSVTSAAGAVLHRHHRISHLLPHYCVVWLCIITHVQRDSSVMLLMSVLDWTTLNSLYLVNNSDSMKLHIFYNGL